MRSRDRSVGIATSYGAGRLRFDSLRWHEGFLFSTSSRPALGLIQHPIEWEVGNKLPGREADHSPPSSIEVKNGGDVPRLSPYVFMGLCLFN
jgi:hypothetical protein